MSTKDPSHRLEVRAFYRFATLPVESLVARKQELEAGAAASGVRGLIVIAAEGYNGTICGSEEALQHFEPALFELPHFGAVDLKRSTVDFNPFRKFKVDIRPEIVTLGDPRISPGESLTPQEKGYLTPAEWNRALGERDILLLDVRNDYESRIGAFRGAVTPPIKEFSEFPDFIRTASLSKEKKVLMYCTGGIRCEKAALAMREAGFNNVHQLHGGILKYIEEFPGGAFEGECFVFDNRVALDQRLAPSMSYRLCPHCGDPAADEISCNICGELTKVCARCREATPPLTTCSKACATREQQTIDRKRRQGGIAVR